MTNVKNRPAALVLAGVLLLAVLAPVAAQAADKDFGVVDTQRILTEYEAARDAQEQVEKFVRDLDKEMLLAEEAYAAKTRELEQQKAEYLRFREQADQRVQQAFMEQIGPINDQVMTIAERIAKEEGFGIIIDASAFNILYLDPAVDLTDKILAALARGEDD
jgi:outer membrane protein